MWGRWGRGGVGGGGAGGRGGRARPPPPPPPWKGLPEHGVGLSLRSDQNNFNRRNNRDSSLVIFYTHKRNYVTMQVQMYVYAYAGIRQVFSGAEEEGGLGGACPP